jgi:hypothetical protein
VLAIGETSGTDTVLGIVLGTIFCAGRQSSLALREMNDHQSNCKEIDL